MYFRQWLHDEHSCASYLVGCPTHDVVAVVDPQGDPERYLAVADENSMSITHVIDTHIHADHVSVARPLAVAVGAPLYLGSGAEVGFDFTPMYDGDVLDVGNRRIRVLHTPGHTPEHVSLLVDDWFVLTGDTLFVGDVGRVDLALTELDEDELRGRAKELYHSLQTLLGLRDDVEVYPGHYAGSACGRGMDGKAISTIGRERRTNEALDKDIESFIAFQLHEAPPLPEDFAQIKQSNMGR
ncbi:MAG: MBL fold metallo-hydrolase [Actinomycetota bacterium]